MEHCISLRLVPPQILNIHNTGKIFFSHMHYLSFRHMVYSNTGKTVLDSLLFHSMKTCQPTNNENPTSVIQIKWMFIWTADWDDFATCMKQKMG